MFLIAWVATYLKKVMLSFGRSDYDGFIEICRKCYFDRLFEGFSVNSIDDLLKKILHKKRICHFPCYRIFQGKPSQEILFKELKAHHRLLVYYLSLFHGYVWICTRKTGHDAYGCNYFFFHDDRRGENFPYHVLKRKRIHNLQHYELIEKGKNLRESTFKFKNDVNIKTGVFKEQKDIVCIKIL